MAEYSDDEQIQRLQTWWQENGTSVVLAIVLSVSGLLGWRYWQDSTRQQAESASVLYQQMTDAAEQATQVADSASEAQAVAVLAGQLIDEFPRTAYADYARLMLARLAVEKGAYEQALDHLGAVVEAPATTATGWTARVRLARVQLHTGETDAAAQTLAVSWPQAWHGQVFELQGDLARQRGDLSAAREAYNKALAALAEDGAGHRELVQMKLDDLVPAS